MLRRDEPGWTEEVICTLDAMFAQDAVGVKIWKDIGLVIKDGPGKVHPAGRSKFDPIYAHFH